MCYAVFYTHSRALPEVVSRSLVRLFLLVKKSHKPQDMCRREREREREKKKERKKRKGKSTGGQIRKIKNGSKEVEKGNSILSSNNSMPVALRRCITTSTSVTPYKERNAVVARQC
uniref:Uncharacterized protein n=1 Tax=Trypanosoma vivax (strain Y486) TaxID=1055687 RepID=G0U6L8_TRYVY|nr:hypothetical protein, unlikely [Trypanosoma vivax Y486]